MDRSEPREQSGGVVSWFAGHHVAANLLMIFVLLGGLLSLSTIVVEIFPEVSIDTITIRVPYLGASPEEVEAAVVLRVEEAVAAIQDIERINSSASENIGTVSLKLEEGADGRRVLDDVKAAVDRIDTFPEETEQPVVSEVVARQQVISVAISGEVDVKTLATLAERVRDDLTATGAVTQVEVKGLPPYEISIEVSESALLRWGLSLAQVAAAVRRSSLDLPGGSVKTTGGEILLRTEGQKYRGVEFEETVILSRSDGTRILLRDVATVIDGFEDNDVSSRFDGRPGALVQVYRAGDESVLDVTGAVHEYVASAASWLPAGVEIATWQDASDILRQRIGLLLKNARLGLILVFLALTLFLDLRLAFWTTMGIPISFLGGLWLLPGFDVTVNMISLFAFIISLGIVVDDAIIVGENVFTKREQGMEPLRAAVEGAREMAVPVTFAVLTSIAAFLPLVFVEGTIGKVMRNIPLVVVAVLLISLLESLLILPAHLSSRGTSPLLRPLGSLFSPLLRGLEALRERTDGGLQAFVRGPYHRFLNIALEWRYLSLSAALSVLVITAAIVQAGIVKFTFLPNVDADNVVAFLKMPQGTPAEQTEAVVGRLELAAEEMARQFDAESGLDQPLIVHINTTIGEQPFSGGGGPTSLGATSGSGGHLAEVNVQLLAGEIRGISSATLLNRWRERVGEVPGATALTFSAAIFNAGDAVSVQLAHRDFDRLLRAADRLKGLLAEYPGVTDIADSFVPGKRELELELTAEGRALGLTLEELARQVRQGFYGEEVQRIQRGREELRVMVRYPREERRSQGDIETMRIRLADGTAVPFSTVAEVVEGRGYATIARVDRRRVVTVTADVNEEEANASDINQNLRDDVLQQLIAEYPGLVYSFEGEQRERQDSFGSMGRNFIVGLFVIFALLAIPFRSYSQPLIVMSAIPFGFVGAVAGHLLMDMNLSMLSFFGMVALTGVVVNDSLIMVDLINRERRQGVPLEVAIRDAGKRRFRPILLTTLTTFLGLTPMILETSLQAQFLIPMAISLGFGVLFATAVTLLLVPVIYRTLEDLHRLFGGSTVEAAAAGEISVPEEISTEPSPA